MPEQKTGPSKLRLYGRHAVVAAMQNKARKALCLHATQSAIDWLKSRTHIADNLDIRICASKSLTELVPEGVSNQGLVLDVKPLAQPAIDQFPPKTGARSTIIMLDQVEDPHNVGAIMRSAAAFGARCLITQDRHSPHESGALAKAASGALDSLPWVRVTNLTACLTQLAQMGYWRIGMAGEGKNDIAKIDVGQAVVLVLGAEGRGLRPLVRKHCDILAHIPMHSTGGLIDSLNVSNAAAITLYLMSRSNAD